MNDNSNTLGIYTEEIPQMACPFCDAKLDVSDFNVFEDIECPGCNETIKVPGRLGDFILVDELGRGAMGCVYLAQDESLNRMVALKVIRREYGTDPKMLETVQREAQAMATLNHRNIVQVYSFGRANEQPYFVMELLQGERLDEMMEGGNLVNEIRALEIAHDVAQGLQAAEKAGLTHGDIKPANILMNDQGVAKVVDFGLAKFMDPDAEIEVWGTPYYIAPEKARKKGEDSRSDQFSLGGTLFHALAGKPPFDGENPTKVVIASLKQDTPVLMEHNPEVTEKTSAVIRRMMDKNPNRRYPTYASLLADLELALNGAKAAEAARRLEEQRALEKANKSIPAIVWIFLFTILMIGGIVGFFTWKNTREKKIAMAVSYEGPTRQLHEPLLMAEVRNLTEAAEAIFEKDLLLAEEKMATARKLIPENHSAMGWYRFLTAGIYFYAQDTDKAKTLLQEVVDTQDMIFDGGFVPDEDPRILASYALGLIDDNDLAKALRKSELYYQQLAEVARGYRSIIASGYNPEAGRYFKTFSEYAVRGLKWPYVTQGIAPSLHLKRDEIVAKDPVNPLAAEPTKERPQPKPTATARPRATPTPQRGKTTPASAFRISEINRNGSLKSGEITKGNWISILDGEGFWLSPGQLVEDANPFQLQAKKDFSVCVIMGLPSASDLQVNKPVSLLHIGNAESVAGSEVPEGAVLEVVKSSANASLIFRVRIGNGSKVTHEETLPASAFDPGVVQLVMLTWDAGKSELTVNVNNKRVDSIQVKKEWLSNDVRDPLILFGQTLKSRNVIDTSSFQSKVYRAFILNHIPNANTIYENYKGRIQSWN
jgi:predicted Ser/Thr protein kinase